MGTFALTLFGLAACSGPLAGLFRGDPLDFGTIDVDKDSVISPRELNTWGEEEGLVAAFGGGEEGVAPVDLASALYAVWNLDGDTLTESEWTAGLTTFFPGEDAGTFAEWDIDQDMALDENELRIRLVGLRCSPTAGSPRPGTTTATETSPPGSCTPASSPRSTRMTTMASRRTSGARSLPDSRADRAIRGASTRVSA
jgi:hypothetical protein